MSEKAAPTLGPWVVAFIQDQCVHGPGEVLGKPVVLNSDQIRFLQRLYEVRPDGSRKFRRACYSRPKGSSKTELAGFIGLVEAFGPARCAGFDEKGEPIPACVPSPDVMVLATEKGQAGLCYSVIYFNLTEGPLAKTPGLDAGRTRIYLPNSGIIRAGTSGAASKEGLRPTLLLADETHLMVLPELKEMHATLWRGIFKRRDALLVETTTAFLPGAESIAELAHKTYNTTKPADADRKGVFYDHRGATCTFESLNDPKVRMKALKEAYGPVKYMPLDEISASWELADADHVEFARFWANMVVAGADAFMDLETWNAVADPDHPLSDGDRITIGLDASLRDDATAVTACRLSDGHIELLGLWQKPTNRRGLDDWMIPFNEVDLCVRAAFERFQVTRLYSDPFYVMSYLDTWSLEFGEKRVFSWPTNRTIAMGKAIQRFHVAVLSQDHISHSNDPVLTSHVGNARVWTSGGHLLLRKESQKSVKKIDALVAAILCYEARCDSITAGEDQDPVVKRRAWSF